MATHRLHLLCAVFAWTPIERGVVAGVHGLWFRDREMKRFFRTDDEIEASVAQMEAPCAKPATATV